jgi:hypothetical protein
MPSWLLQYLLPIIIQTLSPVLTEYLKILVGYLSTKISPPIMVLVATAVAEGVNQIQEMLTGTSLPPGVGALISIFLNELLAAFGKQPPTPGLVKAHGAL